MDISIDPFSTICDVYDTGYLVTKTLANENLVARHRAATNRPLMLSSTGINLPQMNSRGYVNPISKV